MEQFKTLFSALIIYQHNIRVLHWNVAGQCFDCDHEKMGEYVSYFENAIDSLAEIMVQLDIPVDTLNGVIQYASTAENAEFIIVNSDKIYSSKEVYEYIRTMFSHIIELYKAVCSIDTVPHAIRGELESFEYKFRLESNYKNKRRLAETQSE